MNTLDLRQQIEKNLVEISPDNLKIIANFVEFIKEKQETTQPNSSVKVAYKPASRRSILSHAVAWVGDDLEDCLELVYKASNQKCLLSHTGLQSVRDRFFYEQYKNSKKNRS